MRFYLARRDPELEHAAEKALSVPGRTAGSLVCVCSATDSWYVSTGSSSASATCGCNGSSLEVYIGEPPNPSQPRPTSVHCPSHPDRGLTIAIAIGYPGPVPPLGTLDVEQAMQLAIAARCMECDGIWLAWKLHLPASPTITGNEPWIKRIQGLGFK